MDLGHNRSESNKEDRISSLLDDLLYEILKFVGPKYAVQTSILSKRWNRLWANLPYLHFQSYNFIGKISEFSNLDDNYLSKRNPYADIYTIRLSLVSGIELELIDKIVKYAISHNVQEFIIYGSLPEQFLPSIFKTESLKKLEIVSPNWVCKSVQSCWNFGSLINLSLQGLSLPDLPWSFPVLTSLHLSKCESPLMSWSLPALTTLSLQHVTFVECKSVSFEGFVHLKNLTLKGCTMWDGMEVCSITSRNLTHLTIFQDGWRSLTCRFMVLAPKLLSFDYCGYSPLLLSAKDGLPCLEKVNIDILIDKYLWKEYLEGKKQVVFQQLIAMFQEIRGAKFLTLSFNTIEVLSRVMDPLEFQPSPFGNLTCLKLKEKWISIKSTVPNHIRIFLLGSSPSARIVIEDKDGIRVYNQMHLSHRRVRLWANGGGGKRYQFL